MIAARLLEDTIIVRDGTSFIAFSPFTKKVARLHTDPAESHIISEVLRQSGLFNTVPPTTTRDTSWSSFISLTLLLTRACNLGCLYCYASAKAVGPSMSDELAIGATEWFIRQLRLDVIRVTFHGGGEPTLQSDLIKKMVGKVRELRGNKQTQFLITTNGTASDECMAWMIEQDFGISISVDGPPEIQDRNRPLIYPYSGKSSLLVEKNMRMLVDQQHPFSVRVTYSPTDDVEKLVHYFGDMGVKKLHLEPLFPYGRMYQEV